MDSNDVFTTETAGLPEASSPTSSASTTATTSICASIPCASASATQRCACSDTTARYRSDAARRAGLGDHRAGGQRRRRRGDRPLARPQATESLRRGTRRDAGAYSPGETFTYKLRFPDPGLYWYHPHIREDFAQEMGLYAPIIVEPSDPSYWPAVDRQLTITLDDVLIEDGKLAPFRRRDQPSPPWAGSGTSC